MFGRRLSRSWPPGRAGLSLADASIGEWPGTMRMITWRGGPARDVAGMLKDIGPPCSAPAHGFTEREGRTRAPRSSRMSRRPCSGRRRGPRGEVLRHLNGDVTAGAGRCSVDQTLALFQRLLPGITAREVSDPSRRLRRPRGAIFIAGLPASDGGPSEAEVPGALGRAAVAVKPGQARQRRAATTLLSALAQGRGRGGERSHAASGVTSMWLDNGVRVHHATWISARTRRHRDHAGRRQIQETPANRGITSRPARLGPAGHEPADEHQIATMDGRQVRVAERMRRGHRGADRSGDPPSSSAGLQLAYLLLTDRHRGAGSRAVEGRRLQRIVSGRRGPCRCSWTRARPPSTPVETRTKSLDRQQSAPSRCPRPGLAPAAHPPMLPSRSPGSATRARAATRLVARYLGACRAPRIGDKNLSSLRRSRVGRCDQHRRVGGRADAPGRRHDGFFGADLRDVRDSGSSTWRGRTPYDAVHELLRGGYGQRVVQTRRGQC